MQNEIREDAERFEQLPPELQAMADDLLSMEQARAILKIGRNTMLAALQKGELPGVKVGRQWRISKRQLKEYLYATWGKGEAER